MAWTAAAFFAVVAAGTAAWSLTASPAAVPSAAPLQLEITPRELRSDQLAVRLSRDFISDESGQFEVYVRPFPDAAAGKWVISTRGGVEPRWSRDGLASASAEVAGARAFRHIISGDGSSSESAENARAQPRAHARNPEAPLPA